MAEAEVRESARVRTGVAAFFSPASAQPSFASPCLLAQDHARPPMPTNPDDRSASAGAAAPRGGTISGAKRKRAVSLAKDLPSMMYGYGDSAEPSADSVALLENMVFDHIADLARGASSIAELKGGAVEHHDYLFLVRKNVRKYSRIMELLRMKETLDKAKDEYRDPVVDPRLDDDN